MIRFGPAGLGSIDKSVERLKTYFEKGINACEIPFTYGVYMKEDKHKKDIEEIRKAAEKFDIKLSIHAPYWINLNSKEKKKIEESKKRILRSCKIGSKLNAENIVFHPGYYGKRSKEETYENIKNAIIDMKKEIKKNKWKVRLCPETTGKINVFGKEKEILKLVKDTGCSFTIDFAHLKARSQGKKTYKEMYKPFKSFKRLHCHFSGIIWGDKGERKHKKTEEKELRKLFDVLPKSKYITIINESPQPIEDSVVSIKLWGKIS